MDIPLQTMPVKRHRLRELVLARDGGNCAGCAFTSDYPKLFEVDHIIPLNHGGADILGNCQVLCLNCHRSKTRTEKSRYKLPELTSPVVKIRKLRDMGDMVRAIRESRWLTQDELAEANACDRFYVNRLEAGKATLYITRLLRILKFLNITVTLAFEGNDEDEDDST